MLLSSYDVSSGDKHIGCKDHIEKVTYALLDYDTSNMGTHLGHKGDDKYIACFA